MIRISKRELSVFSKAFGPDNAAHVISSDKMGIGFVEVNNFPDILDGWGICGDDVITHYPPAASPTEKDFLDSGYDGHYAVAVTNKNGDAVMNTGLSKENVYPLLCVAEPLDGDIANISVFRMEDALVGTVKSLAEKYESL